MEPHLFSPWIDLALLWLGGSVAAAFAWSRRPRRSVTDPTHAAFLRDLQRIYELPEVPR